MSDDVIALDSAEGGATRRKLLTGVGVAAASGGFLALAGGQKAQAAVYNGTYFSTRASRFVDTRDGGGKISGGETRVLKEFLDAQGVTFAINLTVVATEGSGYLALYNADEERPTPYSSINWQGAGKIVANFNLVDGGGDGISVYCSAGSTVKTHFIIDVVGILLTHEQPVPTKAQTWQKKAQQYRER
jgi:hypothetical protein